jgi:beta-glucosidase-like glycosyl hydrolase
MTSVDPAQAAEHSSAQWLDTARSLAERVDALLAAMTLEEKVAQLGSRWIGNDVPAAGGNVAPMEDVFRGADSVPFEDATRSGLGHLTRVFGSAPVTVAEGAAEVVRLQRSIMKRTRLGIPAIVHEECLTGFTTYGATVFPASIAWAATFDPDLIERMGAAIGRDMHAVGVHQGLAPLLDVVRDYRWGRVEETMGEDPYLVATLGSAYVRGLEGAGIVATLKHFAGYSASRAGRNHGPVSMGRRELQDVILPTFETALVLGGARSVMNSYSDVDGVPAAADSWLLTEVLRGEWGFEGTVVSDYRSIEFLARMHRTAADNGEAGAQALTAGIDVELPDTECYGPELVQQVRGGEVAQSLVDRAARRVLTQKGELGLLDPDWTPEESVRAAVDTNLDSAQNRALAQEVAENSVVLLDPGTALPILGRGTDRNTGRGADRIAVVGPCADDPRTLMGCYAFPNHVLPRHPGLGLGIDVPTPVTALRAELPDAQIIYQPGCSVDSVDRSGFDAALAAARDSDLCIALVGDLAGLFGHGTSGEGSDADDLRLPGVQADLLTALLDTGTPVVVVVISGRPYALGEFHDAAAGLVQAFMPGEEGGAAIAGILSGRVQPSGKLPVQIPRTTGGQPGTYLQPPLGNDSHGISNLDPTPLFPFGHGRSYTSFEVDDLQLSDVEIPTDGELSVSVQVRNTGQRAGVEVVQLYLHDVVAQVTRPVSQLVGYARVQLQPGARALVRFLVHADRTAFTGRDLSRIVEPGEIEVMVGTSSSDLPCRSRLRLTGPVRVVGHERRLSTPVDVQAGRCAGR